MIVPIVFAIEREREREGLKKGLLFVILMLLEQGKAM